jgi:hypothetical protein
VIQALLLTLAVEVPLYVLALAALNVATIGKAALLGTVVNLLTHPLLWWALAPRPSAGALWTAEAAVVVVEAAVLWATVRRYPGLLLVASLGANAASVLIGLVFL